MKFDRLELKQEEMAIKCVAIEFDFMCRKHCPRDNCDIVKGMILRYTESRQKKLPLSDEQACCDACTAISNYMTKITRDAIKKISFSDSLGTFLGCCSNRFYIDIFSLNEFKKKFSFEIFNLQFLREKNPMILHIGKTIWIFRSSRLRIVFKSEQSTLINRSSRISAMIVARVCGCVCAFYVVGKNTTKIRENTSTPEMHWKCSSVVRWPSSLTNTHKRTPAKYNVPVGIKCWVEQSHELALAGRERVWERELIDVRFSDATTLDRLVC